MNETSRQAQTPTPTEQREEEQAREQRETHDLYVQCITKQLEEVDLLSSIYCTPGEMHIFDYGVISDFHDFLQTPSASRVLKARLDYTISLALETNSSSRDKLEVRIELPHLYPMLEHAIVTVCSTLLSKQKESRLNLEIQKFIETMDKSECYIFQVVSWLQDEIPQRLACDASELAENTTELDESATQECERLWIYSHHIKSKKKRQDILRQGRALELTGFCRPGKPGIICVEGLHAQTQEFWRIIKAMNWQKITVCTSEMWQGALVPNRRFDGFREQLFCDDLENEEGVMNMALFIKYLEQHESGYMKKELFGLE